MNNINIISREGGWCVLGVVSVCDVIHTCWGDGTQRVLLGLVSDKSNRSKSIITTLQFFLLHNLNDIIILFLRAAFNICPLVRWYVTLQIKQTSPLASIWNIHQLGNDPPLYWCCIVLPMHYLPTVLLAPNILYILPLTAGWHKH